MIPLAGWEDLRDEDWHGAGFVASVRQALGECGARLASPGSGFAIGRLFWKSVLRGSRQGGQYLADCLRTAAARGGLAAWLGQACG